VVVSGADDGDAKAVQPDVATRAEEDTFDRTVDEGCQRLGRSWVQLIVTGFLGGFDVGVGVLALLLVEEQTHNALLADSHSRLDSLPSRWREASCSPKTSWFPSLPLWRNPERLAPWPGCGAPRW
jgi:hypothetical protein